MHRTPQILALLAVLAGCDPQSGEPYDPQDEVPQSTVPWHLTEDGELTRVQPRPDPLPDDVLADRLERAETAFVGEVSVIEYAEVVLPELGSVPHTFVTFRVEESVKGSPGEAVTLRFLGGTFDDGVRTLEASGIPEFELGERALLFVGPDNGRVSCPLVDCESGRLPIVGDHVTAPTGHVLVTLDDGRTRFAELTVDTDPVPASELEGVRPEPAPLGTPLSAEALVRRIARPSHLPTR